MPESPQPVPEILPISVDYTTLLDPIADLSSLIDKGFGPDGLGILTVSGIPDFPALRTALLPLATEFAQLPDSVKATYEDAESKFNVGWSCGKEILKNGRPDAFKGSFYANPLQDEGAMSARMGEEPAVAPLQNVGDYYAKPNIWPRDHIPEFEGAFKSLGRLMYRVGLEIAGLCDNYLARMSSPSSQPPKSLKACIERGAYCCKARLLCYLPFIISTTTSNGTDGEESNPDDLYWCGWHKDHCALTALCPAMYTPAGSTRSSDRYLERAGLYVKDRHGNTVKVRIPEDHLAFQLGESFQVLSGNVLRATPHCVRAPGPAKEGEVCPYRNTFALFMQPHWDEPLVSYVDHQPEGDLVDGWQDGITFGKFSAQRFASYYEL
jgi:isopenicillin N synthase-like dioxygenase